jgi:hypothetical protein
MNPGITSGRRAVAIVVAVIADLLQLPLTLAAIASVLSGVGIAAGASLEAVAIGIDVVTAAIMLGLLGFHWLLLPTVVLEAVPVAAAAPTWTACVLIVLWRRRRHLQSTGQIT